MPTRFGQTVALKKISMTFSSSDVSLRNIKLNLDHDIGETFLTIG